MAVIDKQIIRSYIASAALEGGRFVKLNGSQELAYCGAGEAALGVLESNAEAGKSADVVLAGPVKIQGAAAILPGAQLASDANGRAVAATVGAHVLAKAFGAGKAVATSTYDRLDAIFAPTQVKMTA